MTDGSSGERACRQTCADASALLSLRKAPNLDAIEDQHGHWTADAVLSVLRSLSNWYSARDDNYTPPLVRNMRRTPPQARKRSRTLTDGELRKVWQTAEADGDVYGAFGRLSLLCGQRCAKTVSMRWTDVSEDGVWTIPAAPREKGTPGSLRLPPLALDIGAVDDNGRARNLEGIGDLDGAGGGIGDITPSGGEPSRNIVSSTASSRTIVPSCLIS
jgi:integrase